MEVKRRLVEEIELVYSHGERQKVHEFMTRNDYPYMVRFSGPFLGGYRSVYFRTLDEQPSNLEELQGGLDAEKQS